MRNSAILAASAAILLAGSAIAQDGSDAAEAGRAIAASVTDPARPAADTARDGARKPAEIVAFAGVKPGDHIAEIAPGGGYYTRILARAVGPEGHVYALMPAAFANRPGGLDAINALAAEYGNVTVLSVDFTSFTLPGPVDLVWTTENYHDLANRNIAGANSAIMAALKPGGIYFVEDHSAPGTGLSATSTLHRIDPAAVIDQVTEAGFTLEAETDILTNPDDPHDVGAGDESIRGRTDRFALRFRKPE